MLLPPNLITILQLELKAGTTDGPDKNQVYEMLIASIREIKLG